MRSASCARMLRTVSDYAAAKGVSRVSEIVADCGELSLVIPQYVEQIYPTVVKGTPFADTKLIVNIVPGMAECDDCDEIFNVIACNGHCPNCNSFNKTVLSGRDSPSGRFMSRKNVTPGLWRPKT